MKRLWFMLGLNMQICLRDLAQIVFAISGKPLIFQLLNGFFSFRYWESENSKAGKVLQICMMVIMQLI